MLRKVAFRIYSIHNVARTRQFYEETLGLAGGSETEGALAISPRD
jgi:extradiol dioxygenase family protein